jgi:5-(carboxyamino)imidazole ribonucleotide synthase
VAAITQIGLPAVLRTADSGYDGKGQTLIHSGPQATSNAEAAWESIGRRPAVLEGWIDYQCELSVLVARSPSGELAVHGPIANDHENHILDVSTFPLPELESCAEAALEIGRKIATALDLVGFACVEFFLTRQGQLLVNEIAPRPHNSGHLTIDASTTSQFEQQVRAICGLPLGSTEPISAAAMVNLLGDLWQTGEPCWQAVLADPHVRLHLYGKTTPRPGRKMGHLTVLADTAQDAAQRAQAARRLLVSHKD